MYHLIIKWNGSTVLDGKASAVMTWENLRVCASQFVNAAKYGFEMPALVDLANAAPGASFSGQCDDGTGKLEFSAVLN